MHHTCTDNACCDSRSMTQSIQEMDFERSMHGYAHQGKLDKVKASIRKSPSDIDVKDPSGYTALHYAARQGHLEICESLIAAGADVNAKTDGLQSTPLFRAALGGHDTVIKLLLSKGADPSMPSGDGRTALQAAIQANSHKAISLLSDLQPQPIPPNQYVQLKHPPT
ncbi:ankyrin repeat-containing domain protein [Chytridium lagenaria]|nr:ankyrin repeat-containing domain protein [Chytridium lagenaria]